MLRFILGCLILVSGCSLGESITITEFGGEAYVSAKTADGQDAVLAVDGVMLEGNDGVRVPCARLTIAWGAIETSGTYPGAPDICRRRLGVIGQVTFGAKKKTASPGLD